MDATIFDYRNEESAAMAPWYILAADAFDGIGGFAAPLDEITECETGTAQPTQPETKKRSYILRHPQENQEKYDWRVRNATYANFLRAAAETLIGFLFSATPDRTWPAGWDWDEWATNVDGAGTPLDDHLRSVALRLLVAGTVASIVDRPREQYDTLADAQKANARTVTRIQLPESLYDWRATEINELRGAKFRDQITEGELLAEPTVYERCRVYLPGKFETWKQDRKGNDPVKDPQASGDLPPQVGVPVIVVGLEPLISGGLLGSTIFRQVADEQLNLYRLMSLLFEHLHAQNFAVLCRPKKEGAAAEPLVLGTDNLLNFDKDGSAPLFIAPPGSVAANLFQSIKDCVGRIYELLGLDALRGGQTAESGIARAWRFNPLNRRLSALTKRLVQYERRMVTLRAQWENRDPASALKGWVCSWPDNFDVRDVERQVKLALDAQLLKLGTIADAAIRKSVRDAIVELKDQDLEDSNAEIDAEVEAQKALREGARDALAGAQEAQSTTPPADEAEGTQPPQGE